MRKIILAILLISPFALASDVRPAYLYAEKNRCVDYFYYGTDGTLYYKYSHRNREYSTTSKNEHFLPGYEFNATSNSCYVPKIVQSLAMSPKDFHFLMGLVGVLVGFTFMFFSVYLFVDVAKK